MDEIAKINILISYDAASFYLHAIRGYWPCVEVLLLWASQTREEVRRQNARREGALSFMWLALLRKNGLVLWFWNETKKIKAPFYYLSKLRDSDCSWLNSRSIQRKLILKLGVIILQSTFWDVSCSCLTFLPDKEECLLYFDFEVVPYNKNYYNSLVSACY